MLPLPEGLGTGLCGGRGPWAPRPRDGGVVGPSTRPLARGVPTSSPPLLLAPPPPPPPPLPLLLLVLLSASEEGSPPSTAAAAAAAASGSAGALGGDFWPAAEAAGKGKAAGEWNSRGAAESEDDSLPGWAGVVGAHGQPSRSAVSRMNSSPRSGWCAIKSRKLSVSCSEEKVHAHCRWGTLCVQLRR